MSLRPITNGECERTRSSARYTDAFFAQKPSASAVVKTSASIASSRVLPFSSMTVFAIRSRLSTIHCRARYITAARSSKLCSAHAFWATRPRATSSRSRSANYAAYASATGLWAGKLSGFGELDALDHDVLHRTVARARRLRLDRVDHPHPVRHATEDRVLAVEPRRGVGRDDEELAAV